MNSALIVLFNPDLFHLDGFIRKIVQQVEYVILVDNTPKNIKKYNYSRFNHNKVIYIDLNDNLGIAKAHNEGIKKAIEIGSEYIIIFDQDSSIDENFVSNMMLSYEKIKKIDSKIATVGPTFIDTKTNQNSYAIKYEGLKLKKVYPSESDFALSSDYIISSGSLFKTTIFDKVGYMDEKLFIDFVDIEWGIRAKQQGHTSYMSTEVFMHHTIGNTSKKIPLINRYINIHSDFRKYFIVRNAFFLMLYSDLPLNWKLIQFAKTNFYMLTILWASPHKIKIISKYILAIKDGIKKKMFKGSM